MFNNRNLMAAITAALASDKNPIGRLPPMVGPQLSGAAFATPKFPPKAKSSFKQNRRIQLKKGFKHKNKR